MRGEALRYLPWWTLLSIIRVFVPWQSGHSSKATSVLPVTWVARNSRTYPLFLYVTKYLDHLGMLVFKSVRRSNPTVNELMAWNSLFKRLLPSNTSCPSTWLVDWRRYGAVSIHFHDCYTWVSLPLFVCQQSTNHDIKSCYSNTTLSHH